MGRSPECAWLDVSAWRRIKYFDPVFWPNQQLKVVRVAQNLICSSLWSTANQTHCNARNFEPHQRKECSPHHSLFLFQPKQHHYLSFFSEMFGWYYAVDLDLGDVPDTFVIVGFVKLKNVAIYLNITGSLQLIKPICSERECASFKKRFSKFKALISNKNTIQVGQRRITIE